MGRYTGPTCRKCRAVGERLLLKAKKCSTAKCILERRKTKPGQHGKMRKKVSDYSIQLSEKQKLRNMYGMNEKQFRLMFEKASRMDGITGNNLLLLLERRYDNLVMRAGFASSRNQARQLVRHGHVLLNGRKVDIPSVEIKMGDKIEIKEKDNIKKLVTSVIEEYTDGRLIPSWIKADKEKLNAEVISLPKIEDIDHGINVQLIVELYSK